MKRQYFFRVIILTGLILLTFADPLFAGQRAFFQTSPQTSKYAVIIGGAAAEPEYTDKFKQWTLGLFEILVTEYGYSLENIILLLGKGEKKEKKVSGPARSKAIVAQLSKLKKKVRPGDQIFFFLVGHGTADQESAKFNLVGPDVTGVEFSRWLKPFSQQDLIVVNTTSTSFPFSVPLSAPGRIVISATRSEAEKYDTTFAAFFVEALKGHAGDYDKNSRLSIWEAFQYAKKRTEQWYSDQERLPTEHPVLDDNGDGNFNLEPNPTENDGNLAQVATFDLVTVGLPRNLSVATAKTHQTLTVRMLELERSVIQLRNRKAELSEPLYKKQLESLLIDLAQTTRALRTLEQTGGE